MIVYTTIQFYRWDRLAYLKTLHAKCKVDKFKIVLMVNSSKILDDKLKTYDKKDIDIIGVNELDNWFQQLLKKLFLNHYPIK